MKSLIEMAREAGFETGKRDYADGKGNYQYVVPAASSTCLPELERFAKLVCEDEFESLKLILDNVSATWKDETAVSEAISEIYAQLAFVKTLNYAVLVKTK